MNRDRALELLPIFEAYANGEEIEWRVAGGHVDEWLGEIDFADNTFDGFEYRIKPKPREFYVCSSYDNQDTKVAYETDDEYLVDHFHEYIKVREVVE